MSLPSSRPSAPGLKPPPRIDYTTALEHLVHHITLHSPPFGHINTDRVLTTWRQARVAGDHGVYATVQGLKFAGGADTSKSGSRAYRWPQVIFQRREILYVLYFTMPRFANLTYRDKLTTVFHELYHISPECNGDLRRFSGRNYAHGRSRESYNARLQPWIDTYLGCPGAREAASFLEPNLAELKASYGDVVGRQIRPPKPVLLR